MSHDVEAAIARLDDVSRRITATVSTISLSNRNTLIELRREHAEVIKRLSDVIDHALANSVDPRAVEISAAAHQRLGEMRAAVALHQGRWPAVLITDGNEEYIASARVADAAKRQVVEWLRREVLPVL